MFRLMNLVIVFCYNSRVPTNCLSLEALLAVYIVCCGVDTARHSILHAVGILVSVVLIYKKNFKISQFNTLDWQSSWSFEDTQTTSSLVYGHHYWSVAVLCWLRGEFLLLVRASSVIEIFFQHFSWATKAWHLIVLQGVLCGSAGAIMYTPVLLWLSDWFHERRGLAGGIIWAGSYRHRLFLPHLSKLTSYSDCVAGTGIGGFIFPFLISGLLSRLGYSGMLRVWSALTLVVFAIAIYIVKPRIPPPRRVRKGERGPWPAFPWFILRDPIFLSMVRVVLFKNSGS